MFFLATRAILANRVGCSVSSLFALLHGRYLSTFRALLAQNKKALNKDGGRHGQYW